MPHSVRAYLYTVDINYIYRVIIFNIENLKPMINDIICQLYRNQKRALFVYQKKGHSFKKHVIWILFKLDAFVSKLSRKWINYVMRHDSQIIQTGLSLNEFHIFHFILKNSICWANL